MNEDLIYELNEVAAEKLEDVRALEAGSEEENKATTDLVKLLTVLKEREEATYKADLDRQRLEQAMEESEAKLEQTKLELEQAKDESKKARKDGWIQFGITTALGLATTIGSHMFLKNRFHEGLEFEKTGCYTARGGAQNVMRQFKWPKL